MTTDTGTTYHDRWIDCTPDELRIRAYYFPWGTKRIPYAAIRSLREVKLSAFRGRGRIWGTGNLRYWASLDPRRPSKHVGLILDLGRRVKPLITPDDPSAAQAAIRAHADVPAAAGDGAPGPLI
jgi:hypothetical protein